MKIQVCKWECNQNTDLKIYISGNGRRILVWISSATTRQPYQGHE
ncbi:hypothetical protein PN456_20515 [Nodularia spumigena CS-586/05]|nr:hypothetical protein [Nodularia spumigena]MDB9345891.1 hypothetical protein [Nodularia spumigena CS-588/06]MDB9371292.1 hypothetical protein [Nodularia spumigena CS-586/05]